MQKNSINLNQFEAHLQAADQGSLLSSLLTKYLGVNSLRLKLLFLTDGALLRARLGEQPTRGDPVT